MAWTPGTRPALAVAPDGPDLLLPAFAPDPRRTTPGLPAESVEENLSMVLAGRESASSSLAFTQLAARWRTPIQLMRFLDDARERNVLRTVGPVHQFRHARLQDRLAHLGTEAFSTASVDAGSPGGTPPADGN